MLGISWLAAKPVSFSRRTLLHGVSKCVCVCDWIKIVLFCERSLCLWHLSLFFLWNAFCQFLWNRSVSKPLASAGVLLLPELPRSWFVGSPCSAQQIKWPVSVVCFSVRDWGEHEFLVRVSSRSIFETVMTALKQFVMVTIYNFVNFCNSLLHPMSSVHI